MQILDVFLPRVLTSVIGCPDGLARQAVVDAAIEFCEETGIVRMMADTANTVPGVGTYDVYVPSGQRVALTQRTWYGTKELKPASSQQIDNVLAYAPGVDDATKSAGEPTSFYEIAPGEVAVFPIPLEIKPLTFRVVTKPARAATQLEDVLFEDWVDAVVAGALARIQIIPDQPFSSPPLAQMNQAKFESMKGRARAEALRGRIRGSIFVAPRRF